MLGGRREPAPPRPLVARRCQLGGALRQPGGDLGRAAARRDDGRRLEFARHALVRLLHRHGQVPRPLVGVQRRLGEAGVRALPFPRRRGSVRDRGVQRVREPNALAVEAQHTGVDGIRQAVRASGGAVDQRPGWMSGGGGEERRLARAGGERLEPEPEQLAEALGHREWPGGVVVALDRPPDLERVQRIAAARAMEVQQPRTGEVEADPVAEERAELARRERLDADARRVAEPEGRRVARAAAGDQGPRRNVREPPQREREHVLGRRVQPLRVVDGHDQRPVVREREHQAEGGARHRQPVGRLVGIGALERAIERGALRIG
jgi:hypothetical protein